LQPALAAAFDSRGFTYLKLGQWESAVADYDSALRLDPKLASAIYGRGLAKLKKGDLAGGNADIAAAKAIEQNIVAEFARYGVH
jgi:tetratricopeptide (TPR) repeat protein